MNLNLSNQISLGNIPTRYYRPSDNIERSVLTRFEKIPTDIYATSEEASRKVAEDIARIIRDEIAYEGVSVIVPRRECIQTAARHARAAKKTQEEPA